MSFEQKKNENPSKASIVIVKQKIISNISNKTHKSYIYIYIYSFYELYIYILSTKPTSDNINLFIT